MYFRAYNSRAIQRVALMYKMKISMVMKNKNLFLGAFIALFFVQCSFLPKFQSGSYVENGNCGLDMKMIYVEGGSYDQGSDYDYNKRTISLDGFWIGESEVTQAQWAAVMGTSIYEQCYRAERQSGELRPIRGAGHNYPMYCVSYAEAQEFCRRLSGMTGRKYELPTEAQWEFAARGGNKTHGRRYSGGDYVYDVAWCKNNSEGGCHPVKSLRPNELEIYDMSGNVTEWCKDWYNDHYSYERNNPQGPHYGQRRVVRGGSWRWDDGQCCVYAREKYLPTLAITYLGFRVVCLK